ncbi:MAG: hypothetical protein HC851_18710 [Acaryochloris sp. RU_4_1]|nr:hypothetical protein [Acaryochloris sp. SU_5_25]NJM67552.1 hypothetical protein [Acaryochloris sp. RU_4_1]NJR54216.1 hypothetical protein [Acaryochloris sp. CRU_2_0]
MTSCDPTTPSGADLNDITTLINAHAQTSAGNPTELLQLLRLLESLHRSIRDELFIKALPANRHGLYLLLREIEAEGGWPYIPRMRLKAFRDHLYAEETSQDRE